LVIGLAMFAVWLETRWKKTELGPRVERTMSEIPIDELLIPVVAETPEARVRAYVAAWHRNWLKTSDAMTAAGGLQLDGLSDHSKRIWQIDRVHFVRKPDESDPYVDRGGGFGSPPEHDPETEIILRVEVDGPTAVVETENQEGWPHFHEYQLVLAEGNWLISGIETHWEPEGERILDPERMREILSWVRPDGELPKLPTGVEPNCHRLFEVGRKVRVDGTTETIEVQSLGEIRFSQGVIGVFDFGWHPDDFRPLTRSVPPGSYPAELSRAGYELALRVLIRPEVPAVAYVPAPALGREPGLSGRASVGVDGGRVSLFDAAAFMDLEYREKERKGKELMESLTYTPTEDEVAQALAKHGPQGEVPPALRSYLRRPRIRTDVPPVGRLRSLPPEAPDWVDVNSGKGDGGYPCYWGLGADGNVVSLTVDFLILAEFRSETITVPWEPAMLGLPIEHPSLKRHDAEVALVDKDGSVAVRDRTGVVERVRLRSAFGRVLADTEHGGSGGDNEAHYLYLNLEAGQLRKSRLEITFGTGYRNP
jgi:hypothetical protein